MEEIYRFIREYIYDSNVVTVIIRMMLAVLAGGIIGNERGRHGSAAGLRTHILVCIGAAMTALTGIFLSSLGYEDDVSRIAAQVISGIGFLGAGMIIVKSSNVITGLTTAAGMWATAAIGIALGFGFYIGAFIGVLACFFTATVLTKLERRRKMSLHIYVEIDDPKLAGNISDQIREKSNGDLLLEICEPKSGMKGNIGLYLTLSKRPESTVIRHSIEEIPGVCFAITE